MSEREFIVEVKRGLLIIMRAMVRRYAMAWQDFLPRDLVTSLPWVVDETVVKP